MVEETPVTGTGNPTDDADRKRRYQSYLDKERGFSEQRQGSQSPPPATPRQPASPVKSPTPPSPAQTAHSRQQSAAKPVHRSAQPHDESPSAKVANRSHAENKPHTARKSQSRTATHPSRPSKTPQKRSESVKDLAEPAPATDLAEDTIIKF